MIVHLVNPAVIGGLEGVEAEALGRICAETCRKCKGAKAHADSDGDLIFTVEMVVAAPDCLPSPDHLQAVLPRALSMLMHAVSRTITEIEFALLVGAAGDGGAG